MNVKAEKHVDCACTKIQQDEHCLVGYPSLLCEICDGKGVVPYVKLDGAELWEIVFGIANEVAHEISDEQYTKIAEAINSVFIDAMPSPRAQALEEDDLNAGLKAKIVELQGNIEAVKNTLSVRCTDVSFLEERCKMLENQLSAPAGYRVIPKQPTDTMVEVMAFNLRAEFGGEFTIANKAFAMAVYKQAWELGIRSKSQPSQRAQALV